MVQDRIRKLLALSQSPNEHEAAAAAAKAHALLAEHNLTMAEVGTEEDTPDTDIGHMTHDSRHSSPWVRQLWFAVAKTYFCDYFYYTHRHRTHHTIIGNATNTQLACAMGDYLQNTVMRLANTECRGQSGSFKTGFKKGAVSRLNARLKEMREAQTQEVKDVKNSSNLPALYEQNDQVLAAYVKSTFGKLGKAVSRERNTSSAGYHAGRAAADNIGLHSQIGDTPKSNLLN